MKKSIHRVPLPSVTYRKLPRGCFGLWKDTRQPMRLPGKIQIDYRLKNKILLDTLIHELLHEFLPDLTEERVTTVATCIAEVLWDHRFREVPGV